MAVETVEDLAIEGVEDLAIEGVASATEGVAEETSGVEGEVSSSVSRSLRAFAPIPSVVKCMNQLSSNWIQGTILANTQYGFVLLFYLG